MKHILAVALLGISFALGWWALDLRSKSLRNEQEMAELRRTRDAAIAAAEKSRSELSPMEENVARLSKERDDALNNGGATGSPGAAKMNEAAADAIKSDDPMNSPKVRAAMAPAVISMVLPKFRKDYAPLLKKWNLSLTDSDMVVSLLPSLEMSIVDYMMIHPSAKGLKPDELRAAAAKLGQDTRQNLTSVLGEERVAELDNFNKELKVNKVVGPYAEQLDITGSPLTLDQKVKLAEALSLVRPEHVLDGPGPFSSEVLRKRDEDRQSKIVQAAAGFLSPDQINGLESIFREQNKQQEAAAKMIDEVLKAGVSEDPK